MGIITVARPPRLKAIILTVAIGLFFIFMSFGNISPMELISIIIGAYVLVRIIEGVKSYSDDYDLDGSDNEQNATKLSTNLKVPGLFARKNPSTILFFLTLSIIFYSTGLRIIFRDILTIFGLETYSSILSGSLLLQYLTDAIGFAFIGGGLWLQRQAKRHSMLSVSQLRERDVRQPILLLRSFRDDEIQVTKTYGSNFTSYVLGFEEFLAYQLWKLGPVIAIGQPGEKLPPIGAAREYISNEEWQMKVELYITDCNIISLILGKSKGVLWELHRLINQGLLFKTILIFPPIRNVEIQERWQIICEFLKNSSFPKDLTVKDALVMIFQDDCEPLIISGKKRSSLFYKEALRLASEDVYLRMLSKGVPE